MPARPNVLVIHTDQHRADCLGAYGNPLISTPNIDALARDGVRFDQHFTCWPVCTPARYSLLCGLPAHLHRGITNHSTLATEVPTFPRVLREADYRTAAVGKMHFTPTYLDVGFEEMELAEQHGPGRWDDDYHRYLQSRALVDKIDLMDQVGEYRKGAPPEYHDTFGALPSRLPEQHHSTTWIGDRAVERLERWSEEEPNLLMAGFIKPHHPFDPPEPWAGMYDPDDVPLPPGWTEQCLQRDIERSEGFFPHRELTPERLKRCTAYYYAAISQIDHQVGRMMQVLRERELYEDTLIVFTSDHGDYVGFHHLLLKGNHMYDPLVRVPLLIKWPGGEQAGSGRPGLVSNLDVAPTIIRQAGCPVPGSMDGLDLHEPRAEREAVFAEQPNTVMARTTKHKLLLSAGGQSLMFDLSEDPLEMNDLYQEASHGAERPELEKLARSWRDPAAEPESHLDEEAPIISRPNARRMGAGHRKEMKEYFRTHYPSA